MYENCKGCGTLKDVNGECHYALGNSDGKCPCTTCIVKSMCEQSCEDFEKFICVVNTEDEDG